MFREITRILRISWIELPDLHNFLHVSVIFLHFGGATSTITVNEYHKFQRAKSQPKVHAMTKKAVHFIEG